MKNKTDYRELSDYLEALCEGVPSALSNLSNASALLYQSMEKVNWVGFYLLREGRLILGPFQGKTACTEIAMGRGVCGYAAESGKTAVVPDVHAFPGHIACDSASRSEIVVPLFLGERLLGVLDIDSPIPARFDETDREGLEALCAILLGACSADAAFVQEGRL